MLRVQEIMKQELLDVLDVLDGTFLRGFTCLFKNKLYKVPRPQLVVNFFSISGQFEARVVKLFL